MPACQNLVTSLDNKLETLNVESITCMVGYGRRLLQRRVGSNHLARHEIFADAKVLERTLRLSAPEFFGGNIDFAEAVGFLPNDVSWSREFHERARPGVSL